MCELSNKIMDRLEQTRLFQTASCIAPYHAISREVRTAGFIEKWYQKKKLLLPLIIGDSLRLLLYEGPESLKPGPSGILEPKTDGIEVPKNEVDLIIVPGVAFDRDKNRMGRGRGFYDCLLSMLNTPRVGICFGFQMISQVPVEPFDKKMDYIITEDTIYRSLRKIYIYWVEPYILTGAGQYMLLDPVSNIANGKAVLNKKRY